MNITSNIFQITDMKLLLSICISALTLTLSSCRDSEICEASGTFEATEIIVSAEAQGKLLRFDVLEGMQLKPNEIVGQIDTHLSTENLMVYRFSEPLIGQAYLKL